MKLKTMQPASSLSCIPMHFSAHTFFGRRLKRWGSTGSWSPTAGGSSESLNLRFSMADLAGDYTKRKHVVRVTSIAGAELLLQAGSADEASQWLNALRSQAHKNQLIESQKPLDSPAEISGLSPPPRSKKHGNTRTISPTDNSSAPLTASPKSKTWKVRVAKQFRRIGTSPISTPNSASSNSSPKMTGAVGIPLDKCESLPGHPYVPYLVGVCTRTVEERGLHVVGVYRVPGNTASVTALLDALEKSPSPDLQDTRWSDVNVVSSLLKAFFRRLPDPLLTKNLYSMFISADKLPERAMRVHTIRRLVRELPDHHYETLKFLIEHLKKVAAENSINKMEARNLAIVFGPTLVRSADDNMFTMVNDMSSQCRIIESLINDMEWYFDEEDRSSPILNDMPCEEESLPSTTSNQALLLQNVKKIEGKMDVTTKDIVSSIISAANRKIQRKPRSKTNNASRDTSSTSSSKTREPSEKPTVSPDELQIEKAPEVASAAVSPPLENDNFPIKTYAGLEQNTQERIKRFEMETRAMLRREKKPNDWQHSPRNASSPITIIDNNTDSQSNVSSDPSVRSNPCSNDNGMTGKRMKTDTTVSNDNFNDGAADMVSSLTSTFDQKLRSLHNSSPLDDASIPYVDECHDDSQDFGDPSLHRNCDLASLKEDSLSKHSDDKNKSENSSIKSANSGSQEIINLMSTKKNGYNSHSEKNGNVKLQNESIAESCCKIEMNGKTKSVEGDSDCEKDVDINSEQSSPDNVMPDNNRSAEKFNFDPKPKCDNKVSDSTIKNSPQDILFKKTDVMNNTTLHIKNKLKRSESLNRETEKQMVKNNKLIISDNCNKSNDSATETTTRVEKAASPKLTRSVSLNRSSDVKLKWSDNLTKSEKTETNSRRRDINYGGLNRASAKLKRKNGMPERSIKRRHTVGGTKDFDKDEWVALSCSRTSSPDLPTTIIDLPIHSHISPIPLESHV